MGDLDDLHLPYIPLSASHEGGLIVPSQARIAPAD